jgi:hypothetical protein
MKARLSHGSQMVLVSDSVGKYHGMQGRLRLRDEAVSSLANFAELFQNFEA